MEDDQHNRQIYLSRRKILAGLAGTTAIGFSGPGITSAQAKTDPVVHFMKRASKTLLKAAKKGSSAAFLRFILRNTDVSGIALYSLGTYKSGLQKKHQKIYFRGMARHITRYFTYQSQKYRIVKAEVGKASWQEGGASYVDTKITLNTGSAYTVRWQIVRRKGRYKIANVRVLGFWLARFQRNQFESFIARQDGRVSALVAALYYRK